MAEPRHLASRGQERSPGRPEHEDDFEKSRPLWYWFEHKKTGFLILFSGVPMVARDFTDPRSEDPARDR